ncbi:MAG: hypothetical protein ACYC21_09980 [Eubacteriales bacterium]
MNLRKTVGHAVSDAITIHGAFMGVLSTDRFKGIITVALEADKQRLADFVRDLPSVGGRSHGKLLYFKE